MEYIYRPNGVCSRKFTFNIENNVIRSLSVEGGCDGNLKGISSILVGMNIDDVIRSFEGIDCKGKGTSCPDQIAKALINYKKEN